MSRLTRKETIIIRENETAACNYENDECNDSCRYGICKWQEKANMRLKQYEDTGLSPEQVQQLKELYTAKKCSDIKGDRLKFATCPTCGKRISDVEGGRFCQNCGQRLDWSV